MFVIANFPLADLRPLHPQDRGRLKVPDWRAVDMKPGFLRGFGQIAARQSDSYGLLGERAFADAQNAIRFNALIQYRQDDWNAALTLLPWFRRLYFDGFSAGRIEVGFSLYGGAGAEIKASGGSLINAAGLSQTVRDAEVTIRSLDGSEVTSALHASTKSMAMAYVLATTRNAALNEFPAHETVGSWVQLGPPIIQLRLEKDEAEQPGRNTRVLTEDGDDVLYVTSADGSRTRNDVIVQVSPTHPMAELPKERARRVIFSHLNALIYAHSQMLEHPELFDTAQSKKELASALKRSIDYFGGYVAQDGKSYPDLMFSQAVRGFSTVHSGRLDELVSQLQNLAGNLNKPSAIEKVSNSAKAIMQLILTTGIKAGVETAMRGVK